MLKAEIKEQLLIKYYLIKHIIFPKNPKYDGYQHQLDSMVYKFFVKRSSGGAVKNEIIPNK